MESLGLEVAPFGVRTMLVEPGFFRTELLSRDSTQYAESTIGDYSERTMAAGERPPARWPAGADAVETFESKAKDLLAQAAAHRDLSSHLGHDDDAR